MAIRRTSHAVYDASYHLVWCPKYRKKLFEDGLIRERAAEMLREISEEYGFEIDKLEVARDHVHVLLSFPPKYSISEVVRMLKSKSGRALFREFPRIKRKLWGSELWGDGYFARTVGDRMTKQVIERYIEHHNSIEQGPAQLGLKLRS